MKCLLSIVALGLSASVAALPASIHTNYVVHEKRSTSRRTRPHSAMDRRSTVPISIGLKQRNLENGDAYLMDVSHPDSSNYGKHWSPDRIAAAFAPDPESINAVISWLDTSGISSDRINVAKGQNWIQFNATVSEAEDLLKTEYKIYDHPQSGKPMIGCDHYSIPAFLVDHVDLITPTVHNGPSPIGLREKATRSLKKTNKSIKPDYVVKPKGPKKEDTDSTTSFSSFSNTTGLASCTDTTSIDCIRFLYNIPQGTLANSSMGVMEFQSTFEQGDLDSFYSELNNDSPPQGTAPLVASIDGGVAGAAGEDFGEATLDLSIAIPLIFPQQVTIYEVGAPNAAQASFGNFLDALNAQICAVDADPTSTDCGDFTPADVISISWGGDEAGADAFNIRQCYEYLKLGLLGTTVLVSSGDNGVQSVDPSVNCTSFQVQFPASCPYVTAVGATTLTSPNPPTLPEIAVNGFGSGGGFSNLFPLPSYQNTSIPAYLSSFPPPYTSSQFNSFGNARAYPDISANGQWLALFVQGEESESGGTSMSAPLAGSVFSLINEELKAVGKTTVGFVNPVLYANPGAMNDVVGGFSNDVGEGVAAGCGTSGFEAGVGWDPVTGLGTPDYGRLLDVFMSL